MKQAIRRRHSGSRLLTGVLFRWKKKTDATEDRFLVNSGLIT